MITVRSTKQGFNVLTESNIDNYPLFADEDFIPLKVFQVGRIQVENATTKTVNHSLPYIPFIFVYANVSGQWRFVSGDFIGDNIRTEYGTSFFTIRNDTGSTVECVYIIFRDHQFI